MTLYVVRCGRTNRDVLLGATLDQAARFCRLHPGHYFAPAHV